MLSAARIILPLLILSGSSPSARAVSQTGELSRCLPLRSATLSSEPSCAAVYALGAGQSLCLSASLFQTVLKDPSLRCSIWSGRWTLFSPAEPAKSGKKIDFHQFNAQSARSSQAEDSSFARIFWAGLSSIERLRLRAARALNAVSDPFGVLHTLLLGETPSGSSGGILRLLGFVHLLHATGVHLYALSELVFVCTGFLLVRALRLRDAGESAEFVWFGLLLARVLSVTVFAFAWALCGFRRSLLRPWCVVLCRMASRALGFRWRRFSPLVLAVGLDLIFFGEASLSSLTYAIAVAGAILAVPDGDKNRRQSVFGTHLRMALGSWCLAGALDAWSDGWVSFATPVLSLLTLPLYGLVIYPALLLGAGFAGTGHEACAAVLNHAATSMSGGLLLPLARLTLRGPWIWLVSKPALLAGAVLTSILLGVTSLKERIGIRQIAAPLGLVALAATACRPLLARASPLSAPEVSLLDVGQGDSSLVESQKYGVGLIDAGSAHRVSELAWLTLIGQRRLSKIDWIAITHFDEDHVGGVSTLARLINIGCMSTSLAELQSERGKRIAARLEENRVTVVSLTADCIPIPYLEPPVERIRRNNANMSAFVVPLASGGLFLSAGDAEGTDEERIGVWMSRWEAQTSAPRILKVSHHGSKTSSSGPFLKLVRPTEAWISDGVGNPYGHPHESVLGRLTASGIPVRRTDEEGTLMTQ